MNAPLITTIIPTYQRSGLLTRAVRSALNQNYPNLQVCVYDNASNDDTTEVIATLMREDRRVMYYRHKKNLGPVANMNYGIRHVNTPFFSLLGDDDVLLPDFYERAMKALETYPDAFFFCSRTLLWNQIQNAIYQRNSSWQSGYYKPSAASVTHMIKDHFTSTGVVFNTAVRESVGYFDELGSDVIYLAKAAALHPFVVSEQRGAVFMVHRLSFTGGNPDHTRLGGEASLAADADYIKRLAVAFLSDMLSLKTLSTADKVEVLKAVNAMIIGVALGQCVYDSIPYNKPRELSELLNFTSFIKTPPGLLFALAIVESLMRNSKTCAKFLSSLVNFIIAMRWRWSRDARYSLNPDLEVCSYISQLCEDTRAQFDEPVQTTNSRFLG